MSGAKKLCGTSQCYNVAVEFEPKHLCEACGGVTSGCATTDAAIDAAVDKVFADIPGCDD